MFLSTLLAALWLTATPVDTVPVAHATVSEPIAAMPVFQTDTTNMGGKRLDDHFFVNQNMGADFLRRTTGTPILIGDTLPRGTAGGEVYVLKFSVSTTRFVKARLVLNKPLPGSTLFQDGQRTNGTLKLRPGVTEFALVCTTDTARRDTFDIALVGENAAALCILSPDDLHPLTLSTMREGAHYGDVRLSPTGRYLLTTYYDQAPDGTAEYWTVLTETASGRVLTRQSGNLNWQWLPTRDELYYAREWNKRNQLVYRTPEGSERVVAEGLPVQRFTLSPSEDYIIFSRYDNTRENAGLLRRLEQPDDRMPDWASRGTLHRYDLSTGITQQLTYGRESVWLNDISPDGQRLLLSFARMKPGRIPFSRTTVLEMNAYTGHIDTLLLDTAYVSAVGYTADGQTILLKGASEAFGGIGSELAPGQHGNAYDVRLFSYDIATHQAAALLPQFHASVDGVYVPLQGDEVYLTATEGSGHALYRLNVKNLKRVRYDLPVSYVQRVSIARKGDKPTAVFTGFSGERARDCYLTHLGTKSQVKCTPIGEVSFDSIYRNVTIGTCQDWRFLSSRGDSIDGFYFLPADFDPAKQYPLIVYYYGGCTPTAKSFEFLYPHTVLAAQGYVVYVVEPSGAMGYSQEFGARHVGTWGKGSADDIIEGVQAFCKAHPYVNTARIGCIGASYGGFMTEYLQTRTDLFRTAISHAGISNIASYWGGGYWGYTYGEVAQYGQFPWTDPDLYTRQSPLFNADKIHTPLLLLHGTADTNVPTTESQQLFTALRILGRPVSFVQVKGENHVVQGVPKQSQWQEAIFAWFAYWLKDQHEWWRELFPTDDFGVGITD